MACYCRASLPRHMLGIGALVEFKHLCRCGREWVIEGGAFVDTGKVALGPFTKGKTKKGRSRGTR